MDTRLIGLRGYGRIVVELNTVGNDIVRYVDLYIIFSL